MDKTCNQFPLSGSSRDTHLILLVFVMVVSLLTPFSVFADDAAIDISGADYFADAGARIIISGRFEDKYCFLKYQKRRTDIYYV